jgi:hypothetical protein
VRGQVQHGAPAGTGQPPGDGEDPQPQPLGFPAAGRVVGQGKGLRPDSQLAGQRDDRTPDLVLGQVVQRQVGKPGVLRAPNPVLGAGPTPMPQLQVGELAARPAGRGVGGERGQPMPVGVGDPQLRAGVRALPAHDHPHPGRPGSEVEQPGHLEHPGTVAGLAIAVIGALPGPLGHPGEGFGDGVGQGEPHRVRQPLGGEPVQQLVRAAGGVGAHQDLAAGAGPRSVPGQLAQRLAQHGDVVGGGVGAGVARAQQHRKRLTGAGRAVIDERPQWMVAKPALKRRRRALLVRVRRDQGGVDVDD